MRRRAEERGEARWGEGRGGNRKKEKVLKSLFPFLFFSLKSGGLS